MEINSPRMRIVDTELSLKLEELEFECNNYGYWLLCATGEETNASGFKYSKAIYFFSRDGEESYYRYIDDSGEYVDSYLVIKKVKTYDTANLINYLHDWYCQSWTIEDGFFEDDNNNSVSFFETFTHLGLDGGKGQRLKSFQDSSMQDSLAKAIIDLLEYENEKRVN